MMGSSQLEWCSEDSRSTLGPGSARQRFLPNEKRGNHPNRFFHRWTLPEVEQDRLLQLLTYRAARRFLPRSLPFLVWPLIAVVDDVDISILPADFLEITD